LRREKREKRKVQSKQEQTTMSQNSPLTHFKDGLPIMVDVSEKPITSRSATAEALIWLPEAAKAALLAGGVGKGDVLAVAQLAGIMGAKQTANLIPLCHPLGLSKVEVRLEVIADTVRVVATAKTSAQTGVEMEAMTAASVAALTVYDMLKAASKGIEIRGVRLLEKTGGKSGDWNIGS
jgi:cyclic pyranopterin monophosphate synthase